jgi:hypothetical protein
MIQRARFSAVAGMSAMVRNVRDGRIDQGLFRRGTELRPRLEIKTAGGPRPGGGGANASGIKSLGRYWHAAAADWTAHPMTFTLRFRRKVVCKKCKFSVPHPCTHRPCTAWYDVCHHSLWRTTSIAGTTSRSSCTDLIVVLLTGSLRAGSWPIQEASDGADDRRQVPPYARG